MSLDPLLELGEKIKTKRKEFNYTAEELSRLSRVSVHYIEAIEKGNRAELPQEVYLVGFLNLIFKALKMDAEKLLEEYKEKETNHIIQAILEEEQNTKSGHKTKSSSSSPKSKVKPVISSQSHSAQYFKIYQLYILAFILILSFCFILVRKFGQKIEISKPTKKAAFKRDFNLNNQLPNSLKREEALQNAEIETLEVTDPESAEEEGDKEDKRKKGDKHKIGSGKERLELKVVDVAWVQILSAESGKVLFEGDVHPNSDLSEFELFDNTGFIVATGNAGGFEYNNGAGYKSLGAKGQLIKWFYPESAAPKN